MSIALKTPRSPGAPGEIPPYHGDLLERPLVAALTTLLPDGRPQTQPVWFSYNPPWLLINTMRGFRKERNMRADPRVTLLVVDPTCRSRWIEVRGLVDLSEEAAQAHLDFLAYRYTGLRRYFGECVPADLAESEIPVLGRVTPFRVVDERSANRIGRASASSSQLSKLDRSPRRALVPQSHRDLLAKPLIAALSTLMPDGHPQTQPVWYCFDGKDVSINTTRQRQKGKNLERDPRATILIMDPTDSSRWIEIRGDVDISEGGALQHLNRLTRAYTPWPCYYGHVRPVQQRERETRIICRIHSRHVVCDAIHRSAA